MHLRQKAAAPEASQELISDVASVDQAWGAILPRFRRRGVRVPRQLLRSSFGLVQGSLKKDPAWLQPLRRTLLVVNVPLLFPRLNRGDGAAEVAVHQAVIADVIHGLGQQDGPVEHLFADERR